MCDFLDLGKKLPKRMACNKLFITRKVINLGKRRPNNGIHTEQPVFKIAIIYGESLITFPPLNNKSENQIKFKYQFKIGIFFPIILKLKPFYRPGEHSHIFSSPPPLSPCAN